MIKKIINTLGAKIIIAIINLFIAIIISQILGASGKGEQGIIITTIAFVLLFCNLFGGGTIIYLIPRFKLHYVLFPSYIWSAIMCFLFYFIINAFHLINSDYSIHVCLLSLIASISSIHTSLLIAKEEIIKSNIVLVIQSILLILALVLIFYFFSKPHLDSYIHSLYIAYTASLIISFIFVFPYFENMFSGTYKTYVSAVKQLSRHGFLNQLGIITQMLSFRLSYYILDEYIGKQSVGVYSNGVSLIESIWLISRSIALVQYARIVNSDNNEYIHKLTITLFKVSMAISIFALIPFLVLPSSVFTFVFGAEFIDVKKIIVLLMPGVLFFNGFLIISHFFSGTGKFNINFYAAFVGLVITIAFSFILIPTYSYYGAAITASISYSASSLFLIFIYLRNSEFRMKDLVLCRKDIKIFSEEFKRYLLKK